MRNARALIAAILAAMAVAAIAMAQGQSPTSPRPRPGIPDLFDPGLGTGGDPGRETPTRFSGNGRFAQPAAEPDRAATEDADSRQRQEAGEQPAASAGPPVRTVTGRGDGATMQPGLITGAAGPPQSATGVLPEWSAAQPAQSGPAAQPFEVILDREVEYGPLPEGGEVLIDLMGPRTVAEFLDDIRLATLWNILVSEEARSKTLEFWITEATPQQAMEILKFHDIYYEYDAGKGYLYVMTVAEWQRREFGKLESRRFALQHTDTRAVEPVVARLLSSKGRLVADAPSRQLHVWDTPDNLRIVEELLADLDAPMKSREFRVAHAAFADVQAALAGMLSPAGSLLPDSRTNTLIAWDQPAVLDRMAEALRAVDTPLDARTFHLDHVFALDTLDYLEVALSDRGVMHVDPRNNSVTVKDVPGRVEEIADLIAVLDRALESRTWIVDYADLDFLADAIEARVPPEMGEIVVNKDVHQITVTAIAAKLEEIDRFIATSDVQRKQVQIEAFIVEVGSDVEREFNINWSYFGSSGRSPIFFDGGSGFNPEEGNLNVGQLPYAVPLYGALELDNAGRIVRPIVTNIDGENVVDRIEGANLAVTLEYLDRKNKATVLSSPRVAVQDGEEAIFENATQVPFVSATTFFNTSFNNLGAVNNTNRVEFIDVGTILKVLPRITSKENILLDISAEDSTFVEVRVLASDQASTVPQKTVRRAETQLRIQSGDTVVLGGLRRDRAGTTETRTPFLGDLPGIGRLFRYPNKQSQKSSLLIFITPTIVDEFTDPHAAMLARAEESISSAHRHNQKSLWGRLANTVSAGKNEIAVAVGQSGDIHAGGERATLEDLRALFTEAPAQVRVVLRRHPRAPEARVTAVMDLAMELERDLVVDDDLTPLVPRYRDVPGGERDPATLNPSAPAEP